MCVQNCRAQHLAATLSFLAVLCITIAFPLACSSGGVMYLLLQHQQTLRHWHHQQRSHLGESESPPSFTAPPSLTSVSRLALKPPMAVTCCSRTSCDRRVRTVARMLLTLPALALPRLSMATLMTPEGSEHARAAAAAAACL